MAMNVDETRSSLCHGGSDRKAAFEPEFLHPAERREKGKERRDEVPREAQSKWIRPKNRRDPIDVLNESNLSRQQQLVPIRFGRMLQSTFAFYRGSAALMASDLAST